MVNMIKWVISGNCIQFYLMKSVSESAIERHYLESILPHPTYEQPKQFLKNKQFYRPEQFIWNNPHRVSHQMYKFYHAYNEQYQKMKEPQLKQLEQQDRHENQLKRIERLRAFRNKAREEFTNKQRNRQELQSKTYNQQSYSIKSKFSTNHVLPIETKIKSNSQVKTEQTTHRPIGSERVMRIQQTYQNGVKKFDAKTQNISKLIDIQNEEFHRKIRSQFAARKQLNDTNSRFLHSVKQTVDYDKLNI